jgi:diguanylate cyclase (GGDEF)-like protein
MSSFRFKLIVYFLLLAMVPLAAAFWGFATVAQRGEKQKFDTRLTAGLRATLAEYGQQLQGTQGAAAALAHDPALQRALARRDAAAVRRILGARRNVMVTGDGLRIGSIAPLAATRQVAVVGPGGKLGEVVAALPLDTALLRRLESGSGLDPDDRAVLILDRRIAAAADPKLRGTIDAAPGEPRTITLGGVRYRALVADTLRDQPSATLGILTRQSGVDAAGFAARRRLLLGLLGAVLLVGLVAYYEGRTLVRRIGSLVQAARGIARGDLDQRVAVRGRDELALLARTFNQMAFQLQTRLQELEAERARLRDAVGRFGDALAATHDVAQLLRVIVETAVESTSASGGVAVGPNGEIVQSGTPGQRDERIEFPLTTGTTDFGSLILFGTRFDDEARMTAASLAAHAVVALENARLHRIVERQALVDGLTGLANRRQCEDALAAEVARIDRFGGSLAVVLADLDDFKDVNDRHGHQAGDAVLREFGQVLAETLRDVDLAARWGGEEFLLVLPGTDGEGGELVAERVRTAFAGRTVLAADGTPIAVTASFGVASLPPAASGSELFAAADGALYDAKRTGKNRVVTASGALGRPIS